MMIKNMLHKEQGMTAWILAKNKHFKCKGLGISSRIYFPAQYKKFKYLMN